MIEEDEEWRFFHENTTSQRALCACPYEKGFVVSASSEIVGREKVVLTV